MAKHVTVELEAEVTSVTEQGDLLGSRIQVGDTIRGHYTYDPAAPDSTPDQPDIGSYRFTQSPFGIELDVNGLRFRTDPSRRDLWVVLYNDIVDASQRLDGFYLFSRNNLFDISYAEPGPFSSHYNEIRWGLTDLSMTALASTRLTREPPDLARWTSLWGEYGGLLLWSFNGGGQYQVLAHVISARRRG